MSFEWLRICSPNNPVNGKPRIYKQYDLWRCRIKIVPAKENGFSEWHEQVYLGGFEDIRKRLMTGKMHYEKGN
jgi:hypothetical protein